MVELVRKIFQEEVADIQLKVRPLYSEIYAKTYTDQELSDLLVFYRSPTGRMVATKAPFIMQQSRLAVAPLLPDIQRDVVSKMFDELCTVKPCTPQMHKQIAAAKQVALDRLNAQAAAAAAAQAAMPH